MQVIFCADRSSSSAEEVAHAVLGRSKIPGVAFANLLTGGRDSREIDLLVCTDTGRLVVVEVKGTKSTGPLVASANSSWIIGGRQAYFAGGPQPHRQAKVAASRVGRGLRRAGVEHPWVEWIVAIAGPIDLDGPVQVDNGWVCRLDQLPGFLAGQPENMRGNPDLIREVMDAFDIPQVDKLLTQGQDQPVAHSALGPIEISGPQLQSESILSSAPTGWERSRIFLTVPRTEWSRKRRVWLGILAAYLGCVLIYPIINFIAVSAGYSISHPGGALVMFYLIGYIGSAFAAFLWVRSPRKKQSGLEH